MASAFIISVKFNFHVSIELKFAFFMFAELFLNAADPVMDLTDIFLGTLTKIC